MRAQYPIFRGLQAQLLETDIAVVGQRQCDCILEVKPEFPVDHVIAHILRTWKRLGYYVSVRQPTECLLLEQRLRLEEASIRE